LDPPVVQQRRFGLHRSRDREQAQRFADCRL